MLEAPQQGPLVVETVANLAAEPFAFNEKAFRFNNTYFGGDRYVCLKAPASATDKDPEVGIVDLIEGNEVERRSTRKADGSMKNPFENVLALRGRNEDSEGHFVQVFNLSTKQRLGDHAFEDEIVFWRWLHQRCLVIITTNACYHWMLRASTEEVETGPMLIFRKEGKLAESDVQVINYSVDNEEQPADIQWCALGGIYLDAKKTIQGSLQLFSIEKQQCQFLESHAGCFGTLQLDDLTEVPIRVFSFVEKKSGTSKVYVMDLYAQRGEGKAPPFKATAEFAYPPDHPNDFPIAELMSSKYGVIYTATKAGYVMVFDIKTATRLVCQRVSTDGIFLCQQNRRSGGIYIMNRKGVLYSVRVHEAALIQSVQSSCPDGLALALSLAKRYGYPAADDYLLQMLRQLLQAQRYEAAARIYASSKGTTVRTPATLQLFKTAKANPGEPSPGLQLFQALLASSGKLRPFEAIDLMRPVVAQGKKEMACGWIAQDKLECTEALGDLVAGMDPDLACTIYQRANCHQKVIQHHVEKGAYNNVISYIKRKNCAADYSALLRSMLHMNAQAAIDFARSLLGNQPPLMDMNSAIDVFLQQNRISEITAILIDVLKTNLPEQGPIQTRLLEINLAANPQSAETLFQQELFTHYDRTKIAQLCEKAGLYRRALEHYSELPDLKRVMMKSGGQMNAEWLANFCANLEPSVCLDILTEMLRSNRGNLESVVRMTTKYHSRLGVDACIRLFENVNSTDGLYYFLGSIAAFSTEPEVHFKYIQAAAKLGNWAECERVVREVKSYDPVQVKDYLKSLELPDPRPLIYLCDIHGYAEELTEYLYRKEKMDYLEVYVCKLNQQAAAGVVLTLLDLGCSESKVLDILQNVRGACPLEPLIPEMEKRGRLALILPWMEARIEEGMTDRVLNNAVAKVYIEMNKDPETFLSSNVNYDPREIGQYCEDKDPHMAVAAYIRGQCDQELIAITTRNGLFRLQAKYLVERQDKAVWDLVLSNPDYNPEHKQMLIDQVVATALPEAKTAEQIYMTVQAFCSAQMPQALLDILERVVLHRAVPSHLADELANSPQLQNLLLYTAMDCNRESVKDLISKLNHFDAVEAAELALSDAFKLYEEALLIYQKNGMHLQALQVMLDKMKDYEGAEKFAEKVKESSIWASVGSAVLDRAEEQLRGSDVDQAGQNIVKAMYLFGKTERPLHIGRVIEVAKATNKLAEMADFLKKVRTSQTTDFSIDSELAYALARTGQWGALETLLVGSNTCNHQKVGDSFYDEGLAAELNGQGDEAHAAFKAAKIFYGKASNHGKLTACHLKLGDNNSAIEAAKRAGSAKSWTEVALAAIHTGDFKVAHAAGLNVVNYTDHLERLVEAYESGGHFDELVALLEAGASTGKTNISVFTELGVAYAKYRPNKITDFLTSSVVVAAGRLNVPKLIKVCEGQRLWRPIVLLYLSYNEYDQAAQSIMNHPAVAWEHDQFSQVLQRVSNTDLLYKATTFYLDEHSSLLNSLLSSLSIKLDHHKLISTIKKHQLSLLASRPSESPIAIIVPFLEQEQRRANETTNIVNDTLHEYYFDLKDIAALKRSLLSYDNFDQTEMAKRLENHELLEMKQLALSLYEKNGKYAHAISLAKKFKQYPQAMTIARKSGDPTVAEGLLRYFIEELKSPQYFAACLQLCYALIRPDLALELAWLSNCTQEVMPFMIQTVRDLSSRLATLERRVEEQHVKVERKEKSSPQNLSLVGMGGMAMLPPPSNFAGASAAFGIRDHSSAGGMML